jgi:PAS domain S-box-containing protein
MTDSARSLTQPPRLGRTTLGLALGITAAVAIACAAGAYFYSTHHFNALLDGERRTALVQGEMMRAALEHQMIENDRSLIGQMVQTFGREPRVARVVLLDRSGIVKYSSVPSETPDEFRIESSTCQACHRLPADQRGSSRVIDTRGGAMLRTVIPFRNREACYRCHDPSHRINGIMILDVDAGEMRTSMNADLTWMVAGSGLIALVLIAAIALIVRVVVLRRLQRFETAARQIAAGDLQRRVPVGGSDTISWLATEFNTMADSMTGLVSDVRTERERLETVINSIDDGIVVLDTKRKVLAANDAFLRRSARSRDQAVGCFCRDVAPGICTAHDCPTLACLASAERQVRICERRAPDGSMRSEEVHASPVVDPSGRLVQIVEVWRDISDRRAAEARLAESHRLASLGLLASGFSHELNTPLATVLMCVEGILRDAESAGWEQVSESASIARDQLLRCRGITQHFLRLSRGQPAPADIIDVHSAVTASARLVEPTARAHGVVLEIEPIDPAARVCADVAELQHALINLLINAVQACTRGGRVTASAIAGDPVRIRVRDQGCGIAPEHQKRIFEPFFSLRDGGTGLGLFLSLNFIRRSGGDIRVESAVNSGSTFEIVLPAAASAVQFRTAS